MAGVAVVRLEIFEAARDVVFTLAFAKSLLVLRILFGYLLKASRKRQSTCSLWNVPAKQYVYNFDKTLEGTASFDKRSVVSPLSRPDWPLMTST